MVCIYWSTTRNPHLPSEFAFSKTETQIIFSVGLLGIRIFYDHWRSASQIKQGPMKVALIGGVLLGLGYILASFMGANFIGKLIFLGVVAGAGIGIAYVVPLATAVKWFPDKKGLVSGLAVAGFGFGAFIWILIAQSPKRSWIQWPNQPSSRPIFVHCCKR